MHTGADMVHCKDQLGCLDFHSTPNFTHFQSVPIVLAMISVALVQVHCQPTTFRSAWIHHTLMAHIEYAKCTK